MILDLIIIAIVILCLVQGWRRGFLFSIGLLFVLLLSFILALTLSGQISQRILAAVQDQTKVQELKGSLSQSMEEGLSPKESLAELGLGEAWQRLISGKSEGLLAEWSGLLKNMTDTGRDYVNSLAASMAHNLVQVTIHIVIFFVILLLSFFLLRLLLRLISKGFNHLPIIGVVNRSLGMLLAFALAIAVCGLLLSLLPALQPTIPALGRQLDQSRLAPLIEESDLYDSFLATFF